MLYILDFCEFEVAQITIGFHQKVRGIVGRYNLHRDIRCGDTERVHMMECRIRKDHFVYGQLQNDRFGVKWTK